MDYVIHFSIILGTAKHLLKIWKELNLIKTDGFQEIQKRVDSAIVSCDVGKLPRKIEHEFDGFTADEWKNWVLIFGIYALKGILPAEHLECFRYFSIACKYLCNRAISENNLTIADNYLMRFCRKFEELYGSERVTPNMHLHGHLKECVLDFGPIYSFWLFSFERYNGILGSFSTNKRNIEEQIIRRFIRDNFSLALSFDEFINENCNISVDFFSDPLARGTLKDISVTNSVQLIKAASPYFNFYMNPDELLSSDCIKLGKRSVRYALTEREHAHLCSLFNVIFPDMDVTVEVSCARYREVYIDGVVFGSKHSRSSRSAYVSAFWTKQDNKLDPLELPRFARPGMVEYYFKQNIILQDQTKTVYLAKVDWYLETERLKDYYGKPVQVYRNNLFEQPGPAMFIPLSRLKCKFVPVITKLNGIDVVIVLERNRNFCL